MCRLALFAAATLLLVTPLAVAAPAGTPGPGLPPPPKYPFPNAHIADIDVVASSGLTQHFPVAYITVANNGSQPTSSLLLIVRHRYGTAPFLGGTLYSLPGLAPGAARTLKISLDPVAIGVPGGSVYARVVPSVPEIVTGDDAWTEDFVL